MTNLVQLLKRFLAFLWNWKVSLKSREPALPPVKSVTVMEQHSHRQKVCIFGSATCLDPQMRHPQANKYVHILTIL